MTEKLVSRIHDIELKELLRDDGTNCPSMVVFIAVGSIPCDHFKAEFETFSQARKDIFCAEILVEENPSIAERLGVTAVPETLLINRGKVLHHFEGPYSHEALKERVPQYLKAD